MDEEHFQTRFSNANVQGDKELVREHDLILKIASEMAYAI